MKGAMVSLARVGILLRYEASELTEGQACRLLGLERVEFRRLYRQCRDAPDPDPRRVQGWRKRREDARGGVGAE